MKLKKHKDFKSLKNAFYKPLLGLGIALFGFGSLTPIQTNAASEQANYEIGYPVSIPSTLRQMTDYTTYDFNIVTPYGTFKAFCIQKGVTFARTVNDLKMSKVGGQTLLAWAKSQEDFKGWGTWELNDDHTNASYVSPSSDELLHIPSYAPLASDPSPQLVAPEDDEDEDDDSYDSGESSEVIVRDLTGFAGHKDVYTTRVVPINSSNLENVVADIDGGFGSEKKQAADAIVNYYVYSDADASGYSDEAKYNVMQALTWAIQFDFLEAQMPLGHPILLAHNSQGKYYVAGQGTIEGPANMPIDDYMQILIGGNYEAMKLYRQVVWKATNMRTIPSFSYDEAIAAYFNPIHLKWDSNEGCYIATVNDENGVLKYFDFNINGASCTDNGDGTLTIKSGNAINGVITQTTPASSKILPHDGNFVASVGSVNNIPQVCSPIFFKWSLENKVNTWNYTSFKYVKDLYSDPVQWHSHEWDCIWLCDVDPLAVTHCTGELNDTETHYGSHNASCYDEDGNLDCDDDHSYTVPIHTCGYDCQHRSICPAVPYGTTQPLTDECVFKQWNCTKRHIEIDTTRTITSQYIDWQDLVMYTPTPGSSGYSLHDPANAYISIVTDTHDYPCEVDVEIKGEKVFTSYRKCLKGKGFIK